MYCLKCFKTNISPPLIFNVRGKMKAYESKRNTYSKHDFYGNYGRS